MRTAIERSLGMSKRQCLWSLLSGILLLSLLGILAGSVAGYFGMSQAAEQITKVERFDRRYSNGMLTTGEQAEVSYIISGDWKVCALSGLGTFVLAAGCALAESRKNLSREPLVLLGSREG